MGQYFYAVSVEKKEHVYSHDFDNGLKLMEHSYIGNRFMKAVEGLISKGGRWRGDKIVWAGDYADAEPNSEHNLHTICDKKITPNIPTKTERYLVNLDTKEFVDMKKIPVFETTDNWEWRLHPLSLLTCEGNGRGGGDFRGDSKLVGKWARNRVVIQKTKPVNKLELIFDLVE